jgi:hypothetical protein
VLHGSGDARDVRASIESVTVRTVYPRFEFSLLGCSLPLQQSFSQSRIRIASTLPALLQQIRSRFIVLLRVGTEIITPDWLSHLLLFAELPDVAFAGPMVLARDGKVSNAGMSFNENFEVNAAASGESPESDGYVGSVSCAREVSALCEDCVMIDAQKLSRIGSSEQYSTLRYQIAALCLRAVELRMRNICNPRVRVTEAEKSRPSESIVFDAALLRNAWKRPSGEGKRYDPLPLQRFTVAPSDENFQSVSR